MAQWEKDVSEVAEWYATKSYGFAEQVRNIRQACGIAKNRELYRWSIGFLVFDVAGRAYDRSG